MRTPIQAKSYGDSGRVIAEELEQSPEMACGSDGVDAAEAITCVRSADMSRRGSGLKEESGYEEDDAAYALRADGRSPEDEAVFVEPSARVPYPGVYIMLHPIGEDADAECVAVRGKRFFPGDKRMRANRLDLAVSNVSGDK